MSRGNLLLIEDEARLRNNLHFLLGRDGYNITPATSGYEGLEYIQHLPFHVVVTNLVMDGFGSFELLEQLVACAPELPIIVMMGLASILTQEEALSRGACDFLAKPFAIGALRRAVTQAIRQDDT